MVACGTPALAEGPSSPTISVITISGTLLPTPDGRSIVAAPRAVFSVGATVASQELGFDPALFDIYRGVSVSACTRARPEQAIDWQQ